MTTSRHSVRFGLPHAVVQGQDTTIEAPVYLSGSSVNPVSGTLTVYNAANVIVVSGAPIAVAPTPSYTISAATVASEIIGAGWRFVWDFTLTSGTLVAENDGALVKTELYCVISDVDIYRGRPALNPSNGSAITTQTDYQDEIDEAWEEIQLRMFESGKRPEWVRSPTSLRKVTLCLVLAIIYEDLASRLDPALGETAKMWRDRYEASYSAVTTLVDTDGDGAPDTDDRTGLKHSVVWL